MTPIEKARQLQTELDEERCGLVERLAEIDTSLKLAGIYISAGGKADKIQALRALQGV